MGINIYILLACLSPLVYKLSFCLIQKSVEKGCDKMMHKLWWKLFCIMKPAIGMGAQAEMRNQMLLDDESLLVPQLSIFDSKYCECTLEFILLQNVYSTVTNVASILFINWDLFVVFKEVPYSFGFSLKSNVVRHW